MADAELSGWAAARPATELRPSSRLLGDRPLRAAVGKVRRAQ